MNDAERSYYKIACAELIWVQAFCNNTEQCEFHNNIIAYHISEIVRKMMLEVVIDRSPNIKIEPGFEWLNRKFSDLTGSELLVEDDIRFLERLNKDTENPGINFMNVSSEYISAAIEILNKVASRVNRIFDLKPQEDEIS